MKGGKKAQWRDEDMADVFLKEAQDYIKAQKDAPFFLYYALQQPHVPRTPHERFVGKTGLGPRGDVIFEADWCIGELVEDFGNRGNIGKHHDSFYQRQWTCTQRWLL